jgi:membrane protein
MLGILKATFQEWGEDKVPLLAAGLAYYTLFSIAPLLLILVGALGLILGENAAQSALMEEIRNATGPQASEAVAGILENASAGGGGLLATIIGAVTLVVGATTVLAQLQNAMNVIWEVKPDPEQGNALLRMLFVRAMSLGLILLIGLLLLASFVLSAFLGSAMDILAGPAWLWEIADLLVSLVVVAVAVALLFKYIPDAQIAWRDVWVGAGATAVLFAIGQFVVGLYIGNTATASSFGAAGSVVILLLWVYFAAQILLLGAEFTQVYARRRGARLGPAEHAVRTADAHDPER